MNRNYWRVSLVLGALIGVAGCAGQMATLARSYTEPTTGELAKVRFSTNGELVVFPNRNCLDWSAPDSGVVVSNKVYLAGKPAHVGKIIGMKGRAPDGMSSAEVAVAANKPIAIDFSSQVSIADTTYTCRYAYSFLPKAGEEYQITIHHDIAGGLCRFEPTSLSSPTQRVSIYKAEQCKN